MLTPPLSQLQKENREIIVVIPLLSLSLHVFLELLRQDAWRLRQATYVYFCFSSEPTGLNILASEEITKHCMMSSAHCWLGPVAVVGLQAHMLKFVQSVP